MLKFLASNKVIQTEIINLFKEANKIKCAVAFWGKGAFQILDSVRVNDMQIICNLTSGGTNPSEISIISKMPGVKIKMKNDLHAKVYWTDKGVIVGSANASANGLSLEGAELDGWEEAAIYSTEPEIISIINQWFSDLWVRALDINKAEINKAKSAWLKNRSSRKNVKEKESFIEAIKSHAYHDKRIYIIIDVTWLSDSETKQGEKRAQSLKDNKPWLKNSDISFWKDYDKLPRNAHVFDFFIKKKLDFWDFYFTFGKECDDDGYQFCYVDKPSSIEMPRSHVSKLKKAVKLLYRDKYKELKKSDGLEISIEEFSEEILADKNILDALK